MQGWDIWNILLLQKQSYFYYFSPVYFWKYPKCKPPYPDNSPPGHYPHHVDIGPDEWFYSLVMILVRCPRDGGLGG